MQNLNQSILLNLPIGLPPLAEQYRIVAKVDELMSSCEYLEAAKTEREQTHDRLVATSLYRLKPSLDIEETEDRDALRAHASFALHQLPRLTARREHIQQIRQTIVDLAVSGRLFANSSAFQRDKKVADFVKFLNGYAFQSKSFVTPGVRLCRNVNVGHGMLKWDADDTACVSEECAVEFQRFNLCAGDIVLSLDRPLISSGLKVAEIRQQDLPCLLLQRVGKAEFLSENLAPSYFLLWLQSSDFTRAIDPGRSKGVPHISTRQVEALSMHPNTMSHCATARTTSRFQRLSRKLMTLVL